MILQLCNQQYLRRKNPVVEITTYIEKTPIVQPTTSTDIYCVSNETGKKMSLSEAREIAKNSVIGDQGTLKDTYSCNESTSIWWIDMKPTIEQYACNPAYVVNINTKEVEINWRCTEAVIRWP
ncbi:MAG: hypothetical protein MPEBLZ_04295 [Candidatus Methanoperedens nitroreducens]|uniref:Uncharacterized protein n=1 Tax=Candidatus Methanoperedens nitratireducens TaxID=1392998 RepID=A0A0P8C3N1_9EURY|nr:MAG: hypothetical protein MPEBLZ_04295 [Candidatus Methanoperedens sp. BLZ1]